MADTGEKTAAGRTTSLSPSPSSGDNTTHDGGLHSAPSDDDIDKDGLTAANRAVAERLVAEKPKQTWKSKVWDTFDKSPEERKFLFKLDAVVLTFASLGYFMKYLDQVNINNAFVSGMREDLGLYGNQLNYITTCWTVGYVIGEIPR